MTHSVDAALDFRRESSFVPSSSAYAAVRVTVSFGECLPMYVLWERVECVVLIRDQKHSLLP